MTIMTEHIEGSSRVHTSIWARAQVEYLDKMEKKAFKKARKAGSPTAHIHTTSTKDRLGLQARGWTLEDITETAYALTAKYYLVKAL